MNWFKENKFLGVFIILLVLTTGASGYLVLKEKTAWTEARDQYAGKAAQLAQLRALKPFRDAGNLEKILAQETEYTNSATAIQARLFDAQRKVKPVDPSAFQGRLRESVSSAINHAREKKVELPKDFYMGFDRYEKELPNNEVTGLLDWQLTAIENLVSRMIDLNISAITGITRAPLPGELAANPAPATPPLLYKYPLVISCLSFQDRAQALLNEIAGSSEFMIIRAVKVENEQRLGPPRTLPGGEAPGPAGDQVNPDGTVKAPSTTRVIAGTEKIKAEIMLDLVQFNSPAETRKAPPTRAKR